MSEVIKVSEAKFVPIYRCSCGVPELDWLYGYSKDSCGYNWGIPEGSIAIVYGDSGVGKSRVVVDMAKLMTKMFKVLYCQLEMPPHIFGSYLKSGYRAANEDNLLVTNESNVEKQVDIAIAEHAALLIVDSVNEIDGYNLKMDEDVKAVIKQYRRYCAAFNGHVILLCQVNKDGKNKGSNSLLHAVDIRFKAEQIDADKKSENKKFMIYLDKNRFGRDGLGYCSIWQHREEGPVCLSENRNNDNKWRLSHGLAAI